MRELGSVLVCGVACVMASSCGESEPAPPTPSATTAENTPEDEPPAESLPAPEPPGEEPSDSPATDPERDRSTPLTAEQTQAAFRLTVDPTLGAVEVVASQQVGTRTFVLYRWNGAVVAREAVARRDDGERRLDVIDDAVARCEEEADDYALFECVRAVVPDVYLACEPLCEARAWGVAVLQGRGNTFELVRRRSLYALSCDDGQVLGESPRLIVRDFDGDEAMELQVRLPVRAVRTDNEMNGSTIGVVAYVLDTELRTQFRVTSHYETLSADVAGTSQSCRARWRFVDGDSADHRAIQVRARCEETWANEESGEERVETRDGSADCPWNEDSDTWECPSQVGPWLFDGDSGLLGETPEQVGLTVGERLEELMRDR